MTPAIVLLIVVAVVGILVAFPQDWDWLGIGKSSKISQETKETVDKQGRKTLTTTKYESAKTLWDWISVLGVPLSLVIFGFWLQQLQQKQADEHTKLEKEIAEFNQNEEALQVYLDRLSTLLIDKNLVAIAAKVKKVKESQVENEQDVEILEEQKDLLNAAVNVIRARTLSILRRLREDKERKSNVIHFLIEAEVICKAGLDLSMAELGEADLSRANLRKVNFCQANLNRTNLSRANLISANLNGANLRGANLHKANLISANLSEADFSDADLSDAYLRYANLHKANFSRANLKGTGLKETKSLTDKQLEMAKLCKTILPEGSKLNPDRDCTM